jgi:nucleoside-diphosphate-sugar epimerase
MPRALIAGCGYLGRALADLLVAQSWEVEGWTVSAESALELSRNGHRAQQVDISSKENVVARKTAFDAVIHCASTRGGDEKLYRSVYLDGAENLVECFEEAKVLFVSSTSVYAQTRGELVTEESAAEPKHETGKVLREAEQLVLASQGVVARLGGIYGPGRSALLQGFLDGRATLDPDKDRFVNHIHRDDAAAAISILLKSRASAGQIYNVVDNEPNLLSDCYRWLASALNRPLPPSGRPVLSDVEGSTSKRKRGDSNKRVSNGKLRSVDWVPRYPTFAVGMEKSVLRELGAPTRTT